MSTRTQKTAAIVISGSAVLLSVACGNGTIGDAAGGGTSAATGGGGTGSNASGGGSSGVGSTNSGGGSSGVGATSNGGGSGGTSAGGTAGSTSTGGASGGTSTGGVGGTGGSTATPFRFLAWADTKTATNSLSALSDQAAALAPVFTIYPGDLVDSWSDSAMDTWVKAINGQLTGDVTSNKTFEKTFPVRGNHEGSSSGFANYMVAHHPMSATAAAVGATHFSQMAGSENEVYSFDYGNSHFTGLDALGDADNLSPEQIAWFDQDLTAAEGRGLTHAFLFLHGPIYCVDGHCCTTSGTAGICDSGGVIASLVGVINKHPILTASFNGHEHVNAHVLLDSTRDPLFKHPIHQFHTAAAGAGPSSCATGRVDWCMSAHGFATVDVTGKSVKVSFYEEGIAAPQKEISINKP